MSQQIAEFLLQRIAEDEECARRATQGRWKLWGMQVRSDPVGDGNLNTSRPVAETSHEAGLHTWNASHTARWDPARVLAECEAKRRIVQLYAGAVFAADCHPEDKA